MIPYIALANPHILKHIYNVANNQDYFLQNVIYDINDNYNHILTNINPVNIPVNYLNRTQKRMMIDYLITVTE